MMIYKKVSPGLLYIFIVLSIKTRPLFYENMLATKLSTLNLTFRGELRSSTVVEFSLHVCRVAGYFWTKNNVTQSS